MSFSSLYESISKFVDKNEMGLPIEINERIDENDYESKRIKTAILMQKMQKKIDVDNLDGKAIKKVAKKVNASDFHFSGNCVLLSRCLLYNLMNGRNVFCAINTYPIFDSIDSLTADYIMFGRKLKEFSGIRSVDDLEKVILLINELDNRRFFIVRSSGDYSGHSFNAVVLLDSDQKPYVQFVDAWKTSNVTPSKKMIKRSFFSGKRFSVMC